MRRILCYILIFCLCFASIEPQIVCAENTTPKEHTDNEEKKGDQIGKVVYQYEKKQIAQIPILSAETVRKARYGDYLKKLFYSLCQPFCKKA